MEVNINTVPAVIDEDRHGSVKQLKDKLHKAELLFKKKKGILVLPLRPATHLSQNTQKWGQDAKNGKCIARYFALLFSHFKHLFSHFVTFRTRAGIRAKTQRIL